MLVSHQSYYYKESKTIENLRVILCFMILLIHVPFLVKNQEDIVYSNGIIYTTYILFKRGLLSAAVPIFFFISGYLFFLNVENFNHHAYIKKLNKRLYSLLIPYIVWNIIYIGYQFVSEPSLFLTKFNKWGG